MPQNVKVLFIKASESQASKTKPSELLKPTPSTQTNSSFVCPHCNIVIDTRQRFSSHMKIHKVPAHKCTKCERLFKSAKNMAKHECAICSVCGLKALSRANLRLHMKKFHAEAANAIYSVQCDYCGKLIKTKTYLIHHMRAEHVKDETTTLLCSLCGLDFANKFMLNQHMKISHAELIPCKLCGKVVKPLCMPYHMKQVHASERNFTCSLCSASFKTRDNLKDHVKVHNKSYACQFCEKRFARRFQLNEHSLLHTNPDAFGCAVCGHKYSTLSYLKRHMRAHEDGTVKCRVCGVEVSALSLHYHLKSAHPFERFACVKCNCSGFASQREFNEHMRMHERERVEIEERETLLEKAKAREKAEELEEVIEEEHLEEFIEEEEEEVMMVMDEGGAHEDDHNYGQQLQRETRDSPPPPTIVITSESTHEVNRKEKEKLEEANTQPIDMLVCDVIPTRQRHRKRQKKSTPHPAWLKLPPNATLTCDMCGEQFDRKSKLLACIRRHKSTFERRDCELCGKTFPSKFCLRQHMKSHDSTLIACELCGKRVKPLCMSSHLKQVHTHFKTLVCAECGKAFKTRQNLRDHEKSHSKRFQCEVCGHHFARGSQLNEHMLKHVAPEQLDCAICKLRLSDKRALKKHVRNVHASEPRTCTERPFKCELCEYRCAQKGNLKAHLRKHEKHAMRLRMLPDALKCELCDALFTSDVCLKMHRVKVHSDERFPCTHCEVVLKTKNGLWAHLRKKHEIEPEKRVRRVEVEGEKRKRRGRKKRANEDEPAKVEETASAVNVIEIETLSGARYY